MLRDRTRDDVRLDAALPAVVNGYTGHPPTERAAAHARAAPAGSGRVRSAVRARCADLGRAARGPMPATEVEAWRNAETTLGIERVQAVRPRLGVPRRSRVREAAVAAARSVTRGGHDLRADTAGPLEPGTVDGRIDAALPPQLPAGSFSWLWVDVHNDGNVVLPGMVGAVPNGVHAAPRPRWWDARTGRIVAFGETTPLGRISRRVSRCTPGRAVRAGRRRATTWSRSDSSSRAVAGSATSPAGRRSSPGAARRRRVPLLDRRDRQMTPCLFTLATRPSGRVGHRVARVAA